MDNNGVLFAEGKSPVPEGFVDLGLSSGILWSTKNIGATNGNTAESWYGNYYAWGEIETKEQYNWTTYKYGNGDLNNLTKYCTNSKNGHNRFTDDLTQLVRDDDVAKVTNSAWRIPTKAELEELLALPNELVTNYNGVSGLKGRVFTGNNGNTLFIPAAGYRRGSKAFNVGSCCHLWSSSLRLDDPLLAYILYFYSDGSRMYSYNRSYGLSVRPIC